MTIGPAPMIRIELMSVRFGMRMSGVNETPARRVRPGRTIPYDFRLGRPYRGKRRRAEPPARQAAERPATARSFAFDTRKFWCRLQIFLSASVFDLPGAPANRRASSRSLDAHTDVGLELVVDGRETCFTSQRVD